MHHFFLQWPYTIYQATIDGYANNWLGVKNVRTLITHVNVTGIGFYIKNVRIITISRSCVVLCACHVPEPQPEVFVILPVSGWQVRDLLESSHFSFRQ